LQPQFALNELAGELVNRRDVVADYLPQAGFVGVAWLMMLKAAGIQGT